MRIAQSTMFRSTCHTGCRVEKYVTHRAIAQEFMSHRALECTSCKAQGTSVCIAQGAVLRSAYCLERRSLDCKSCRKPGSRMCVAQVVLYWEGSSLPFQYKVAQRDAAVRKQFIQ